MKKNCLNCKKEFFTYRRKRKCCSHNCFNTLPSFVATKLGSKNVSKRADVRLKMSKAKLGKPLKEKSHNWVKGLPTYAAVHMRLKRYRQKPKKCINCGRVKRLSWAHIHHSRSQNLNEYIALCFSCHKLFDLHKIRINLKASDLKL